MKQASNVVAAVFQVPNLTTKQSHNEEAMWYESHTLNPSFCSWHLFPKIWKKMATQSLNLLLTYPPMSSRWHWYKSMCPWNYHITRDNTASSTSIETSNKGWHEAHTVQVKSNKQNSIGTHKTCRSCYYYLRHSTWLLQWLLYSCCAIVFWRNQNQDGPVWVYRN